MEKFRRGIGERRIAAGQNKDEGGIGLAVADEKFKSLKLLAFKLRTLLWTNNLALQGLLVATLRVGLSQIPKSNPCKIGNFLSDRWARSLCALLHYANRSVPRTSRRD